MASDINWNSRDESLFASITFDMYVTPIERSITVIDVSY